MESTLNYRQNLQYDPIKINDFCVVEIYTNFIAPENGVGYFIQPLTNINNPIETIEARVRASAIDGYEHLIILAGRNNISLSHKRIYAVWYNGNTVPSYPPMPIINPINNNVPATNTNLYQTFTLNNIGGPTDCAVILTLSSIDNPVDFYINNDYFKIDLSSKLPSDIMKVTVDKYGVIYNTEPIDSFEIDSTPKLTYGVNTIQVNRTMVTHVDVQYRYII